MVEAKSTHQDKMVRDICPAASGGKDWQPMAYSPDTGLLYIPHNNLCMDMEACVSVTSPERHSSARRSR
jgi:glucose dehydrogenase